MAVRKPVKPVQARVPKSDVHPKVAAGGLAGAIVVMAVYAANQAGYDLPAEVTAALVVLISTAVGYLKRS